MTYLRGELPRALVEKVGIQYQWGYERGFTEGERNEAGKYTPASITFCETNEITETATNIVFMPMRNVLIDKPLTIDGSLYIIQTDNDTKSIDIMGFTDDDGNPFIRVIQEKGQ